MSYHYQIRQCVDDACRFRYPAADNDLRAQQCPRCGAETITVSTIPLADEPVSAVRPHRPPLRRVDVLLDNIRSLYNVGSIFRTADGAGVRHLYLCGITPTPDNPKLAKTALGAERTVDWSYHANAVDLMVEKRAGYLVWALEETPDAVSLFDPPPTPADAAILLVVGNEVTGVDPGVLALCDASLAIPMQGAKRSLNVATAFGVAAYAVMEGLGARDW